MKKNTKAAKKAKLQRNERWPVVPKTVATFLVKIVHK